MKNYKIKISNKEENEEAQKLLFDLGYKWYSEGKSLSYLDSKALLALKNGDISYLDSLDIYYDIKWQELTLQQLRDLVVLQCNDVRDATHIGRSGSQYYKGFKDYFFNGNEWIESTLDNTSKQFLKPISKPQMTWREALRAVADEKEVEFYNEVEKKWYKTAHLSIDEITNAKCDFRIAHQRKELNGKYTKEELLKIASNFRIKPSIVFIDSNYYTKEELLKIVEDMK